MSDNIQKLVEGKIIDCINFDVEGRLVIIKPDENMLGANLSVVRRGKYDERPIYLKINSFVGPTQENIFISDIVEKKFNSNKNFYLIFVYFDKVTQKISDYVWLVPSEKFLGLAEVIKSQNDERTLRFETNLDIKNKNEYSKYLVSTSELGKLILSSLEDGTKIKFKRTGFDEKIPINLNSLINFLYDARSNTYAANANPDVNPRLESSTQMEFQKGDYLYRVIYFNGNKKFIGQEIVYQGDKPIWGMNYIGSGIEKEVLNFLRESLFKLVDSCRLGKICEYKKREYLYRDNGQGTIENFSGKEEILINNKGVYQLDYNGGVILSEL